MLEDAVLKDMIRRWFPEAHFGTVESLNLANLDWPELVVSSRQLDPGRDEGESGTEVEFHLFPDITDRPRMLCVKLALMHLLARECECRVYSPAHFYTQGTDYAFSETFLCTGGRFYTARVSWMDLQAVAPGQWTPLENLPAMELDQGGRLVDSDTTKAFFQAWISNRTLPERIIFDPPPYDSAADTPLDENPGKEELDLPLFGDPEEPDEQNLDPYLQKLDAWERGFGTSYSKQLIGDGVQLPPADQLNDQELHEKLWQIIQQLAQRQTYLYCTDHLSDRELYEHLWKDTLNHDAMDIAGIEGAACHLDLLGSGSEDDKEILLKYYDSPEERAAWWVSWPSDLIPKHEKPPFDRDQHLPKREYF